VVAWIAARISAWRWVVAGVSLTSTFDSGTGLEVFGGVDSTDLNFSRCAEAADAAAWILEECRVAGAGVYWRPPLANGWGGDEEMLSTDVCSR
jgi:hypothetical protein